jgi:S-adenosylmethionine:tRNA ribosyltransferase-isomerase
VRTADFDYELPEELIAQQPLEPRDAARLLVLDRATDRIAHQHVGDLPALLEPGDVLIANRSRVIPARILGRLQGGGRAEVLLLRKLAPAKWQVLARPARRLRPGDRITVTPDLSLRIEAVGGEGIREIVVEGTEAALREAGTAPLPPYIKHYRGDPERYQTIFADVDGSAAAPTAGLHFTPRLLAELAARGIATHTLVLHIGPDTFRPVTEADPLQHPMHREWYQVPPDVQGAVARAKQAGRRVVAVGTTSVRALEAWAASGAVEGETNLFIVPGFRFRVVDSLLTNFHLPRSTLLMLVSAFAGRERVLAAYAEAAAQAYRFYSFGDAMLLR